ncbi:hypothetical protein P7C70_g1954, partial [Phenoliferia sp. Uapishka_3]
MQSNNPYNRRTTPPANANGNNADATSTSPTRDSKPKGSATEPTEPPPSYGIATTSSTSNHTRSSSLQLPESTGRASSEFTSDGEGDDGVISAEDRAAMEEESRELPEGWLREFDEA